MFLKCFGHQIDEWNIKFCSADFDELWKISTCILQTSHSQISANWWRQCPDMNFFLSLCPPKILNAIFPKVYVSKLTFCSKDFDELCRTELRDFANGIWKIAVFEKMDFWSFGNFFTIWTCIIQQIFFLNQCVFVQERNVLSSSSKCH